jgi:hypothetical protein
MRPEKMRALQHGFNDELEKIAFYAGPMIHSAGLARPGLPINPLRLMTLPIRVGGAIATLPTAVYKDLRSFAQHKGWVAKPPRKAREGIGGRLEDLFDSYVLGNF